MWGKPYNYIKWKSKHQLHILRFKFYFLKNAAYIVHTYAQKDRKKRDKDGESDISE